MVVCPCGVMVPAAGVGRARRGNRGPTGCFDSPATVTTQPKEPQDTPASVEKLAAAAAATTEPSSIPRPLSRGAKNKGPCKGSEESKIDHASRTTLALATTESGRYVGTRPLRSNRSPTPTLHRLPQKTSRDTSAGGTLSGGRLHTKHLPAVRTSPTTPLDNHDTGASRGSRHKGPTALPRQNSVNNAVNQRMNDINSNQRRLLKQTNATQLRNPAANPATKTFQDSYHCNTTNAYAPIYVNLSHERTRNEDGANAHEGIYENYQQTRLGDGTNAGEYYGNITRTRREEGAKSHDIYENVPHSRNGEDEVIYENVRTLRADVPTGHPADECLGSGDVTGKQMKSSADSPTPGESLVWLSDSWKYNTIKKAPEFNIFEFSDIDPQTDEIDEGKSTKKDNIDDGKSTKRDENEDGKGTRENKREMKPTKKEMKEIGKGDSARKREMTFEKGKKKIRSKLPLFGWRSDRQNKDKENKDKDNKVGVDPAIKTLQTLGQVLKPDNKRTPNVPLVPEIPVSIHRSKIQKPSTCNASFGLKDIQRIHKEDATLCQAERGRGGASRSPAGQIRFVRKRTYNPDQDMERTSRSPSTSPVKSGHPRKPDPLEQTGKETGERHKSGNMSRGLPSCASPLISPGHHHRSSSPSSQMAQAARGGGGGATSISSSSSSSSFSSTSSLPRPSPNPSRRQVSQKSHRGNLPLDKNLFSSSSTLSSSPSSRSPSLTNISSDSSMENVEDPNQEMYEDNIHKRGKHQEKENIPVSWSCTGTSSRHPYLPGPEGNVLTNKQGRSKHTQRSKPELNADLESDFNLVSSQTPQHPTSSNLDIRKHISIASYNTIPRHHKKRNITGDELEIEERREARKRERDLKETSSISPYNSIPKKERRKRNIENEEDKEVDDEGRRRRRERPASCTLQDTEDLQSRPESSGEMKKRYKQSCSREASSSWKENDPFRRAYRYSPALPSPTPSCPPPVDERQATAAPFQYHSLPQLYLGAQDCLMSQQPLERGLRSDIPSSRPYYMGDLYRTPIPGISRSRRYSQTSLIDQALESLELSSLIANESQMSPSSKRNSLVPFTSQTLERCPVSSSARTVGSATSPVLPPLPVGVLDRESPPPKPKKENDTPSPEAKTNLASVCILSFDLTVDCEESSTNGFNVVNIINNTLTDQESDEDKSENVEMTFELAEVESPDDMKTDGQDNKENDTVSVRSGSLSIDEKYYENDDYDTIEDNPSDFISEEQQRQLDKSIALLSERYYNNIPKKSVEKRDSKTTDDDDDEDFIEIDCDVKPMEALKRPLVYGYGNGPVRTFQGKSFLEKRLSQASDMSEYMEMDIAETIYKMGGTNEIQKKSESCMNLKETYWDYWQAKKGIRDQSDYQSSSGSSSRNCSPCPPSCPSDRFCYDPEVLLAHVRCPKSLEDATFKQYSACVKSHIYDYFGNVQDTLKDYGLSNAHRNRICSQPDLLPDTPRHRQASGNLQLDYSSEPELTNGSAGDSPYRIPPHLSSKRAPPPRPPPSPLQSKGPSQDSGTWTYLQSSQESASGFCVPGTYPVPLPRSTSSLSHIGPVTYNPWQHLLPDVTPPRTPRHSLYYTTGTTGPVSRSASPSPSRGSLASVTSETTRATITSHHNSKTTSMTQMPQQPSAPTTSKRSFFPSLSRVVKSPLRKPNPKPKPCGREDSMDVLSELPTVHPSIQKRTHTTTSAKSSSSSSSSSSASSKDSVTTVIPATARNKGPNWLMRHFGGGKSNKMAAV